MLSSCSFLNYSNNFKWLFFLIVKSFHNQRLIGSEKELTSKEVIFTAGNFKSATKIYFGHC